MDCVVFDVVSRGLASLLIQSSNSSRIFLATVCTTMVRAVCRATLASRDKSMVIFFLGRVAKNQKSNVSWAWGSGISQKPLQSDRQSASTKTGVHGMISFFRVSGNEWILWLSMRGIKGWQACRWKSTMENAAMNRAENHAAANVNDQVWQVCQTVGKKNAMRRVSHGMKEGEKKAGISPDADRFDRAPASGRSGFCRACLRTQSGNARRQGQAVLSVPDSAWIFSVRKIC